jgi:hypothetical protein
MSKSKEKSKEATRSSSKIPAARESVPKISVSRESSSRIPAARESSKIPAARESSSKIPAVRPSASEEGGRGSVGKMKAVEARDSAKSRVARATEPPPEPPEVLEDYEDEDGEDGDRPKRAMGLRGAAPWAARHAAKHAAEARKRAAEPPPPGSARATIRTPSGVEEIKARITELHNAVERVKAFRKNLSKSFFDLGLVLRDIQDQRLFEAKGFQNFEAFVEREIDLSKSAALRLVKLVSTFTREQSNELGLERALEALVQLEGNESAQAISDSKLPIAKPLMPTSVTRGPIVGRLAILSH